MNKNDTIIKERSRYKNGCKKHPDSKIIPNPFGRVDGVTCEQCATIRRVNYENNFIRKSIKIHKQKYDYTKVFYIANFKKVIIICPKHGEFLQAPSNHVRGQGCDKCLNDSLTYSQEQVLKKFKEIHGDVYDYKKVKYINWKTTINIICLKHGDFQQAAGKHMSGQGCPKCKMSHGERKIEQFLIKHKIKFINQKTFPDCIGIGNNKLKYDFYLPKYNILIEYDGEQHFSPRFDVGNYKEAAKKLERVKALDDIKNKYAKKNNIFLIRISYKKLKIIEKTLSLVLKDIINA